MVLQEQLRLVNDSDRFADVTQDITRRFADSVIRRAGVTDDQLMKALYNVDRAAFVPLDANDNDIYKNSIILLTPDGLSTMSEPALVAEMIQLARLKPTDTVLEIGTGSGYSSALTVECVPDGHVTTVEIHKELSELAATRLNHLGYSNITVVCGDGLHFDGNTEGYDAIIVTAKTRGIPESLLMQLKDGGRMIIPVEKKEADYLYEDLKLITRNGNDFYVRGYHSVRFVAMISDHQNGYTREEVEERMNEMKQIEQDEERLLIPRLAEMVGLTPDELKEMIMIEYPIPKDHHQYDELLRIAAMALEVFLIKTGITFPSSIKARAVILNNLLQMYQLLMNVNDGLSGVDKRIYT